MKLYSTIVLAFAAAFILSACSSNSSTQSEQVSDETLYKRAIVDAMVADDNEICSRLISITDTNKYLFWKDSAGEKRVLVLTWTKHASSYSEGSEVVNSWGEIWVTAVPEMKDWFVKNNREIRDTALRTEQLLGLPKGSKYTTFVELWVRPSDLFRPSADNEITDNVAQIEYPAGMDSSYRAWFEGNIIYSYFPMRYPWTRLGYTYDRGSVESEVGLSEFVIKPNSRLKVNRVYTNTQFFNSLTK